MRQPASNGFPRAGASHLEEHEVFELYGTPAASATARRLLLAGNGALPANVREKVVLLLTELVNNAVRHGGAGPDTTVRVEFRHWSRTVRVEVHDDGAGFATPVATMRRDDDGGWGLLLVDRIADCWAVRPTATGTCVWFEIRYDEAPSGHQVAPSRAG